MVFKKGDKDNLEVVKKTCIHCGKEFDTIWFRALFCSKECKIEHEKLKFKKTCKYCGKEFMSNKKEQEFCNGKCSYNYRKYNLLFDKTCGCCGKKFMGDFQTMYCSDECKKIMHRKSVRKKYIKYIIKLKPIMQPIKVVSANIHHCLQKEIEKDNENCVWDANKIKETQYKLYNMRTHTPRTCWYCGKTHYGVTTCCSVECQEARHDEMFKRFSNKRKEKVC